MIASKADASLASAHRPGRLVLLGHPIAHSLSPIFQNAALKAAGIALTYEAIDVTQRVMHEMFTDLRGVNGAGNVTIPLKILAYDACDHLTPLAAKVGAVNTFWFGDRGLCGDNTDVGGFDAAVRALATAELTGARVVVLGAGGAAAAVLAAVSEWDGASAVIISRNEKRASALASRFRDVARVETSTREALRGATLLVNATPIGQQDDAHPVELDLVPDSAVVLDLVYRRGGTAWVKAAKQRGFRASDGLPMLLEQGALAFHRWFGFEPDRGAMKRSLL